MGILTDKYSFEIGTSKIRIVYKGKVILEEKCEVEIDSNREVIALGNDVNSKSENRIVKLIQSGVIRDFNGFEQLLRFLIKKNPHKKKFILPPQLKTLTLINEFSSEIEMRAVRDAMEHAGSRDTSMLYSSFATLKGVGINSLKHQLIIDAGAGKISFTILNQNKILKCRSLRWGAEYLKEIIQFEIKRKYGIKCSSKILDTILAEDISISKNPQNKTRIIYSENNEAISIDSQHIIKTVKSHFNIMENELEMLIDAYKDSYSVPIEQVIITGGLSKLNGFETNVSQITKLPVLNKTDKNYTAIGLCQLDQKIDNNELIMK